MKQTTLTVKSREGKGRGPARRLRAQGCIPAVIYGKSGAKSLAVEERDFRMLMRGIGGSAALIELKQEGAEDILSVIQATQRNPVTDKFEHIDFQEVVRGEAMTARIPIHTTGTSDGVKNFDGVLDIQMHDIEVSCRPRHLPEEIVVDVTELKVGDAIHIGQLPELEGVTYKGDSQTVVIHISGKSAAEASDVEAEAEEAAAEETK